MKACAVAYLWFFDRQEQTLLEVLMSRSIWRLGLAFLGSSPFRGEGQDRPAPKSKDSAKRGAPGSSTSDCRLSWERGSSQRNPEGEGESRVQIHHGMSIRHGRREDPVPRSTMEWHGTFGYDTYKKSIPPSGG